MNNIILDSKMKTKQLYAISSGLIVLYRLELLTSHLNFNKVISFIILILTIIGVFQILFKDSLSSRGIKIIQVGISLVIFVRIINIFIMNYQYMIGYRSSFLTMIIPSLLNTVEIAIFIIVLAGLTLDPKSKKGLKPGMHLLSIAFIGLNIWQIYKNSFFWLYVYDSNGAESVSYIIYDFISMSTYALFLLSLAWVFFEKRMGLKLLACASIWIVVGSPIMILIGDASVLFYLYQIVKTIAYALLLIVILRVIKEPENNRLTGNNNNNNNNNNKSPFELS